MILVEINEDRLGVAMANPKSIFKFYFYSMRYTFMLILLFWAVRSVAQPSAIVTTATQYIDSGKFDRVGKYLDSLLKLNPKNVDALMMRGKTLMGYTLAHTTPTWVRLNEETVFIPAEAYDSVVIIPKEPALKIAKIWKECLEIDSTRLDVLKELGELYAQANMREQLLALLPVIARFGRQAGGDGFSKVLITFAQELYTCGDVDGSLKMYEQAFRLFPNATDVWCIMETNYMFSGDLEAAKKWADKIYATTRPDTINCRGAIDVYTRLGEYDKALPLIGTMYTNHTTGGDYLFYEGIYRYAQNDPTWQTKMRAFVRLCSTDGVSDNFCKIARYMLSPEFTNDYESFKNLANQPYPEQFYIGVIYEKGMRDFKDSTLPYILTAENFVDEDNFAKANIIFEQLANKEIPQHNLAKYLRYYAYSLYRTQAYAASVSKWQQLKSMFPGLAIEAYYFMGQCYIGSGNKKEAIKCFDMALQTKPTDNSDSNWLVDDRCQYFSKLHLDKLGKK